MGLIKGLIMLMLCVPAFILNAQDNRYMVFFKDKAGSSYSISDPSAFLSARAIERRNRQGLVAITQDIPVNENYIQGVSATGAGVVHATRWMNGVLVSCDEATLN